MCGISGIFDISGKPVETGLLKKMTSVIRHRGPDDEGYILINTKTNQTLSCFGDDTVPELKEKLSPLKNEIAANLALSNRRLAVLDLSAKGHQPMSDSQQSVWLTYNGEIYNYRELRLELSDKGYSFKTTTDTEVIINAYLEWDLECQTRFRGMWAFALWDDRKKRLFCSRDRFGIKPLYYLFDGNTFLFGSELKQLLLSDNGSEINEKMFYRLMKMGSFLYYNDETLFTQIKTLPHSHFLTFDDENIQVSRYYDLPIAKFESSELTFSQAVESYRDRLTESVKLHLRSDIEVGSCLSGGLDSSAIVALAARMTGQPIRTFTAYYSEPAAMDERKWVRVLRDNLRIESYEISPRPADFISDFTRITHLQEYPLIGSSPLSQYYVMKLASEQGIKVVLDGQGNDEINIGYAHSSYRYFADLLSSGRFKTFVSQFGNYLKTSDNKSRREKIAKTLLTAVLPESVRYGLEIKHYLPNIMTADFDTSDLIGNLQDLPTSKLSTFLYHLIMTIYLQTLLHFEDRNSMAFSIESRVPFLDHQLVEFLLSLPADYKIEGGVSKKLHREGMKGIVPAAILNRNDKVNFATPAESIWLRGEMKEFVRSVLWSSSFRQRGFFQTEKVYRLYDRFMKGRSDLGGLLWKVVACEIWFRQFTDQPQEKLLP